MRKEENEIQISRGRVYKLKLMSWKELGPTESRKTVSVYLFTLLCMVLEEEKQRILGLSSGPRRPEQGSQKKSR